MEKKKVDVNIKWSMIYLTGAILQMGVICGIKFLLEQMQVSCSGVVNFIFLAVGGTSSAIWGIVVSKKSGHISSYIEILKDYFHIRQPVKYYGLVAIFLLILFGIQIFTGKVIDGVTWYMFPMFFAQAIVFGGIEEIGWRYTFQPLLEKRICYEAASFITFLAWGTWHYMYFYITDTISMIRHDTFLVGLLGSCFIMGAIYRTSHSLWLCVLYHCLLNMFSQTLSGSSLGITIICNGVGIALAVLIVRKMREKSESYFVVRR